MSVSELQNDRDWCLANAVDNERLAKYALEDGDFDEHCVRMDIAKTWRQRELEFRFLQETEGN